MSSAHLSIERLVLHVSVIVTLSDVWRDVFQDLVGTRHRQRDNHHVGIANGNVEVPFRAVDRADLLRTRVDVLIRIVPNDTIFLGVLGAQAETDGRADLSDAE